MNDSSMIYRAIITSKFRTEKMLNFYNLIGDNADQNTIYLTFGRDTAWSEMENEPGFAPPYPVDSPQGVQDVWTNMLGAVKIKQSYLDAVIPRKDWGDSRYPNPRTFHVGDIVVTNTMPNNRAPGAEGWLVYKVVDVPSTGTCSISTITNKPECNKLGGKWTPSIESFNIPSGRGDTEGLVDTGDGYLWEYLYEIPPDVSINRCTNEYIVVPWPDEIKADPVRWGYQHNLSWQQNDYGLVFRMKTVIMRFKAYLDSVYFPEASILGNKGFRQISMIMNPLEAKPKPTAPNVKAIKDHYSQSGLDRHSGEMIYIENRQPIIRSMDQTEEVAIFFEF
ncbi:baseplate wedge subunit [Acinetobacter phage ZZ1]|uniref:Baseplate wedge subunit n=2 Tax=Zedzedvirus zz1 TaxID=2843640 RepID=A0A410T5M0_9CAUD|nr:baseplate wedge subunit [Acinetobacter phage ZZ1]AFL47779.1 baseplate wedge subunit [Acinetobacter phage ZZ1]QAU04021.1 baseplate wedge subunit [Acinetobacter phage Henu6]